MTTTETSQYPAPPTDKYDVMWRLYKADLSTNKLKLLTPEQYDADNGHEAYERDAALIDKATMTTLWADKRLIPLVPNDFVSPDTLRHAYETFSRYQNDKEAGSGPETRETIASATTTWPEPPSDAAYYGLAGAIIRAIAPNTEADPIGLLGTFLSIFGTYAGSGWTLFQGERQHTNLFVTLVGETGNGRKGTAFSVIRDTYALADPDWQNILVPGLGSGEGLITYLKTHEEDPRALIFETEFARLLTAMTREGSTLSPIIRNAWDGVPMGRQIANASQSNTIYQHHVGVLSNITNIELAQKLNSVDAANGFGNRFLWLAVRRRHLLPFTERIDEHVQPFIPALTDALEFSCQDGFMAFSPEARGYWEVFYRNRPVRQGLIGALTGRAEPYVARLAMIYALLDRTNQISLDHLRAGEAVWDYAERSALYIFGDSTGDKNADALLTMLNDQSPVDWETAKKELGLHRAADLETVVSLLERMGRVRLTKIRRTGNGGRGSAGRPRRELELVR